MRCIYCPVQSDRRFTLNWMQRIQDEFPCGAWEPEKMGVMGLCDFRRAWIQACGCGATPPSLPLTKGRSMKDTESQDWGGIPLF